MATLIIPDVHERIDWLSDALLGRMDRADRIVFLGDWFDAFGKRDLGRLGEICRFINLNIDGITLGDRVIPTDWLLGNHDCHYFFRHDGFKCSGYDPRKQDVIDANVPRATIEKFRIFTKVGSYLVSHAGFCEATLQYARPEVEAEALKLAYAGKFDPIFGAGRARGGWLQFGGPMWLDWNAEFEHVPDCPQIVGHTQGQNVRAKGITKEHSRVDQNGDIMVEMGLMSYCLDTSLHHVAWVDEDTGAITVEPV